MWLSWRGERTRRNLVGMDDSCAVPSPRKIVYPQSRYDPNKNMGSLRWCTRTRCFLSEVVSGSAAHHSEQRIRRGRGLVGVAGQQYLLRLCSGCNIQTVCFTWRL